METTNKQLNEQLNEQLNKVEKLIYNTFSRYKRKDNKFRVAIEEDGKVNKIAKIKDYLNTNCIDYDLSIKFSGGSFWQEYTTILSIEVVE